LISTEIANRQLKDHGHSGLIHPSRVTPTSQFHVTGVQPDVKEGIVHNMINKLKNHKMGTGEEIYTPQKFHYDDRRRAKIKKEYPYPSVAFLYHKNYLDATELKDVKEAYKPSAATLARASIARGKVSNKLKARYDQKSGKKVLSAKQASTTKPRNSHKERLAMSLKAWGASKNAEIDHLQIASPNERTIRDRLAIIKQAATKVIPKGETSIPDVNDIAGMSQSDRDYAAGYAIDKGYKNKRNVYQEEVVNEVEMKDTNGKAVLAKDKLRNKYRHKTATGSKPHKVDVKPKMDLEPSRI